KAATKIIPNLKKLTQESLSHQQQKQPILKKNRSKRQQHKEQEYEEQQEYQEQEYQEHDEQETPHLRRSLRLQKIQKPSSKPQRELSKKKNVNVIEEVFIGGIVIGKSDAVDIYSVNNNLLSKNSPETPLSIIVNEMELDM
ncbi:21225_t:CDS:2, partial [Entrophospora sp. SA101]